jgi:ferrochelatase
VNGPVGLLVMAYGTASAPDDVERYYTDIRGGRPPSPEALAGLKARYAAIGNRFPLLDITRRQADGVAAVLNADAAGPEFRPYLGMKHSPPFIPEVVARMREDGIERAVGIVMAPHWSGMSVETYIERVEKAVADGDGGPAFTFVRRWYDHPRFVDFLAARVAAAAASLPPNVRRDAAVIFSAHSLPVREGGLCLRCTACEGGCEYDRELRETASLVGAALGLRGVDVAWQSAGHTADPWRGPPIEDAIREVASRGHPAVVVCSAGFVADHLEILYDLDIETRRIAEGAGLLFARTEMPNDDPAFLEALAGVVRDHLAKER